MNGRDIFLGLSYIDERYIQEAEQAMLPRRSLRRPLLLAAVLALTLLLVGCAVVYARIQMKLVQHNPAKAETQAVSTIAPTELPPNVLTDCYPQQLPEGYILTGGAPSSYTTRTISYENPEGKHLLFGLSTDQSSDLVLAPPVEKTAAQVGPWEGQLQVSERGAQALAWYNAKDGYYGNLYTDDLTLNLPAIGEEVAFGTPLPLAFLARDGKPWDPWYPQQIPQGYQLSDVPPPAAGQQTLIYTAQDKRITYRVSLTEDLCEQVGDMPTWEETTVAGHPAKLLSSRDTAQRCLFWQNPEEGFYAMLCAEDPAVDLAAMAQSAGPGPHLSVSKQHLGPDYTIAMEQNGEVYTGWEPIYPQQIPEGFTLSRVDEPAYGIQTICYESEGTAELHYTLYFRLSQYGMAFEGMGQPESVDICGHNGYLSENRLIWTDEAKGLGFCLEVLGDAKLDLTAIAESVAPGPALEPTNAGKIQQALEQLGDYQLTDLPDGLVRTELTGFPREGSEGYAYVLRWYVSPKTNRQLTLAYASYQPDGTPVEERLQIYLGGQADAIQWHTIQGCPGASIQSGAVAKAAWCLEQGQQALHFTLISSDYSAEQLLEFAQRVQPVG